MFVCCVRVLLSDDSSKVSAQVPPKGFSHLTLHGTTHRLTRVLQQFVMHQHACCDLCAHWLTGLPTACYLTDSPKRTGSRHAFSLDAGTAPLIPDHSAEVVASALVPPRVLYLLACMGAEWSPLAWCKIAEHRLLLLQRGRPRQGSTGTKWECREQLWAQLSQLQIWRPCLDERQRWRSLISDGTHHSKDTSRPHP